MENAFTANGSVPTSPAELRATGAGEAFARRVTHLRHELNNFITHIVGFTDILLEETEGGGLDPIRPDLGVITSSAARMLARIDAGLDVQKIERAEVNLADLTGALDESAAQVSMAVDRIARTAGGAGEVFRTDLFRIAGAAKRISELAATIPDMIARGDERRDEPAGTAVSRSTGSGPVSLPPWDRSSAPREGRILVVDDLEENRELLSRRLSRLGHRVHCVESGAAALEAAADGEIDVILLDVMMPGLDGIEVLQRLKANPATERIPVLMLSSADEIGTVVRCIQLGADDFLPKPFDPTLLMARLESSLTRKRLRDQEEALLQRIQAERETSDRLLLNILPRPVAARLKQGETVIADSYQDVTVLFSDFVDFTKLSARLTPRDLVQRLNRIFSAFDELCERAQIEKIKIIGDAYMVVAGAPTPRPNHAEALAELALDMQLAAALFAAEVWPGLQMRIGMHTGPVVAGVIGTTKFAYDMWGDTVNLASRMQTRAPAGGILVTAATHDRLADQYAFEPGRLIRVKGRGAVLTYQLRDRLDR